MKINNDFAIAIIGAGTAGLTAAIYAARAGQSVIVLDGKGYGGQIGVADKVENYPGFKSISGFDFSTLLYEQAKGFGVKIKFSNVLSIVIDANAFQVATEKITYTVSSVIIATGLEKRKLGLDNENQLIGNGISYCATCDGSFFKGKDVAVIGGGNTALEDALYLAKMCNKVYLVHRRNEYRAENSYIDSVNITPNIVQLKNYIPTKILGETNVTGLVIKNNADNTEETLQLDGIFTAIGQMTANNAFADIISIDENGYIISGEDCKTSVNGIFVAGDCRTKAVRQLVTAAADGAIAGISAAKFVKDNVSHDHQ